MSVRQRVYSANGQREMRWVAVAILSLLVAGAILLPFHQATSSAPQLASHEVDITQLDPKVNAMITELSLAHMDIQLLRMPMKSHHDDAFAKDSWPDIDQLEAMWLSPFVRDHGWQHKGQHQWRKIAAGIYQGISEAEGDFPQYLLNVRSASPHIWFNTTHGHAADYLTPPFSNQQLAQLGWQQVTM